jgi:kynurenine formamidase
VVICANDEATVKLIDLTLKLGDGVRTYPGGPKMSVMDRISHEWSAGRYLAPAYSAMDRIMLLNEHTGTHVDAPHHMYKDGARIDQLDLDQFYGTAILADASDRDPSMPLTRARIEAALASDAVELRRHDILIVRCWAGERDDPGFASACGFSPEVGEWLARTGIKALGVDLPSVDSPGDRSFPVHIALFAAGITIYENLAHLDRLPRRRFTFMGLPLLVAGAGGSAVRAVAMLDGEGE